MANVGPDTNASQFFFVLADSPHLNSQSVVFGTVTEGMSILEAMEKAGDETTGVPSMQVTITKCGQIR